jgi:hypothetical protein
MLFYRSIFATISLLPLLDSLICMIFIKLTWKMTKVFFVIPNLTLKSIIYFDFRKEMLHLIRRKPILHPDSRGQNLKINHLNEDKTFTKEIDMEEK